MIKKKIVRMLSLIMALAMVLSLGMFALPQNAAAATTQSEIDALKAQRNELKDKESSLQSEINALKSKKSSQVELKSALDEQNALTLQQIMNLEEQIELHSQLIEQKTEEVEEAQKAADDQLDKYKKRIRAMEENGSYNYFEVLFGASSIGEFLSLIDDIGDIMRSDKELENSYRDSVKSLNAVKEEYEAAQADMKEKKAELVVLSDQLKASINEASAVIASLQKDISSNSDVLSQLSAQDKALRSDIESKIAELNKQKQAELAKQQAELEKQQAQNQASNNSSGSDSTSGGSSSGGSSVGSGSLKWPSDCTYITSRQGPRTHPITGQYNNHGGTDIGAHYGAPIYAADSGTVITSCDGWNSGWGNYVMIDHGNGMQTLYAHMSSRAVSVGQNVSKGQVIGYVGATGMATGAHLHYEVYVNGSRVNPESYYSGLGLTYSPTA